MGDVFQFRRCGDRISGRKIQMLTSANNWKQYCRELDALHITEIVTKLTGYALGQLRKDGRMRKMAEARQLFVLLAREHTTYSYPKIGTVLNRDHTSIMHLDKRKRSAEVEAMLKAGNILADEIKERVFGPPVL
jgi:chromosomal replication initiation ATPase DnaA